MHHKSIVTFILLLSVILSTTTPVLAGSSFPTVLENNGNNIKLETTTPVMVGSPIPPATMFQWPWTLGTSWQVTQGPHGTNLSGLDINKTATPAGSAETQEIRAAAAGTVTTVSSCYIVINHGNGWSTGYVHVHPSVVKNQNVQANQKIAVIDTHKSTASCGGNWGGPHLHFRMFYQGSMVSVIGATFGGWKVGVEIGYTEINGKRSFYTKNGTTKYIYNLLDNTMASSTPPPCCTSGLLQLSQNLSLSTTIPDRNQGVTASFKVKNVGGSALTIQSLSAGARLGTDWNGVNVDFPAATNFTLQPGQEYIYQQSRSFNTPGVYFAEPVVQINGQWGGIPNTSGGFSRVGFTVGLVFKNGVSSLWQDQNWGRLNLTITASNLNGQNICVRRWRSGRDFGTFCQQATSNTITFYDLDLAGPMNSNTTYYSQAAMNQNPNPSWPAPGCAGPTGGQGLCDALFRP